MSIELFCPVPIHPDGRKATISDGYHTQADLDASPPRATRLHAGVDWMYRRWPPTKPGKVGPFDDRKLDKRHISLHYEMPDNVPCMAIANGIVVQAEDVSRGGYVLIDHGNGIASQYMHLGRIDVAPGEVVWGGKQIGIVGGDISGYPLFHLHMQIREKFQTAQKSGVRVDPMKYIKLMKHLKTPVEMP